MISFKNFLNTGMLGEEHEIKSFQQGADLIQANCQQFLKESEGHYLCRGIKKFTNNKFFYTPQPHDRPPVDSSGTVNVLLSMGFQCMLGRPSLRASSYFGTGNSVVARDYGPVYYIFPLDGYSYVWSQEIEDAHLDNSKIFKRISSKLEDSPLELKFNPTFTVIAEIFKTMYYMLRHKSLDVDINSQDFYNVIKTSIEGRIELDKMVSSLAPEDKLEDIDAAQFIEAVGLAFKELYIHDSGLYSALNSSTEIAFFKGKGYYAISKDMLEEEGFSYSTFYKSIMV